MPTTKEIVWGILGITLASVLLMIAVAQLDSSAWAESVRAGILLETERGESQPADEAMGIPEFLMPLIEIVSSLIRIMILMGIPAFITLAILRRIDHNKKHSSSEPAPS